MRQMRKGEVMSDCRDRHEWLEDETGVFCSQCSIQQRGGNDE